MIILQINMFRCFDFSYVIIYVCCRRRICRKKELYSVRTKTPQNIIKPSFSNLYQTGYLSCNISSKKLFLTVLENKVLKPEKLVFINNGAFNLNLCTNFDQWQNIHEYIFLIVSEFVKIESKLIKCVDGFVFQLSCIYRRHQLLLVRKRFRIGRIKEKHLRGITIEMYWFALGISITIQESLFINKLIAFWFSLKTL